MAEMTANADIDEEIRQNCEAFMKQLPALLEEYRGKHALMHNQKIVGMFFTVQDAVQVGKITYKDGMFSVQEVTK